MPLYEYQCLNCGKRTEVLQRLADAPLATCPECGGEVKKLISSPAFQFKGSGWYVTDYGGKKGGGGSESKSESKSESSSSGGEKSSSSESAKPAASESKPSSSGSSGKTD